MLIAPGVDSSEWQSLQLSDPKSPDWGRAIEIFESRSHERLIAPVDHLINTEESKPPVKRRFVFAIMAIDCLLVETLGAFLDGLENTGGTIP
jgi:hypothetical protein